MAIVFDPRSVSFYEALFIALAQPFFVNFLCFIFLLVVLFAHMVYFCERSSNSEHFPSEYLDGIDDAMWWSIVTVTTVGGEKVPITVFGRILAVIWMVIGIVMFSILAGIMSSNFSRVRSTIVSYDSISDIVSAKVKVCSYPSEFNAGGLLAAVAKANAVPGKSMDACGELMRQGKADVTVMDRPIANYWRMMTPWATKLAVSSDVNSYSIALIVPEGGGAAVAQSMNQLNPALMDFTSGQAATDLALKWFPSTGGVTDEAVESIKWDLIGPTIGLIICYMAVMFWKMCFRKSFNKVSSTVNLAREISMDSALAKVVAINEAADAALAKVVSGTSSGKASLSRRSLTNPTSTASRPSAAAAAAAAAATELES